MQVLSPYIHLKLEGMAIEMTSRSIFNSVYGVWDNHASVSHAYYVSGAIFSYVLQKGGHRDSSISN